jgi:hypothetical protein
VGQEGSAGTTAAKPVASLTGSESIRTRRLITGSWALHGRSVMPVFTIPVLGPVTAARFLFALYRTRPILPRVREAGSTYTLRRLARLSSVKPARPRADIAAPPVLSPARGAVLRPGRGCHPGCRGPSRPAGRQGRLRLITK